MNNKDKIEQWFQKWFHNQPGISDVANTQKLLHEAKQDLLVIFSDDEKKSDDIKKKV